MKRFNTRQMVYLSLFICLNIVLTRIASIRIGIGGVEGIRIGLGGMPLIMAGVLFGPVAGGIVGALGDIVGYFINPLGPYMPHFTLTAALTGAIPALILYPKRKSFVSIWHLLLAIAIGQSITSIVLVPYFLESLFKIPLVVTLPGRLVSQAIVIPLYTVMTNLLLKRLDADFIDGVEVLCKTKTT